MANHSHPTHPVARVVASARATFAELVDAPTWSMSATESAATLLELSRLRAQAEAVHLAVLAQVDATGAAAEAGASSTANWYAANAHVTRAQASREVRIAKALLEHEPVADALQQGLMHLDQADVVLRAVDQLPDEVTAEQCGEAECHLVAEAQRFDAKSLRVLGKHLVEVVAPEVAEAHTAKLLEAEERAAAVDETFRMWEDAQGRWQGKFTLDRLHGSMLKKALLAFAAPKHQAADGPLAERRPSPERLGRAFGELIETCPADRLPDAGGLNATVVVTMTLRDLQGGDRPATLDTGGEVSASLARKLARKLACEAGLVPAVLGTDGSVLDLGRRARLFTGKQRLAMALRDKGCTAGAATGHPACATPTTRHRGVTTAPRTWPTGGCSARSTTPAPTTRPTRHDPHPATASTSTGASEWRTQLGHRRRGCALALGWTRERPPHSHRRHRDP